MWSRQTASVPLDLNPAAASDLRIASAASFNIRVRLLERYGRIVAGRKEHKDRRAFGCRIDAELQIGLEIGIAHSPGGDPGRALDFLRQNIKRVVRRAIDVGIDRPLRLNRTIDEASRIRRIGTLQILHQRGGIRRIGGLLVNNHAIAVSMAIA